MGDQVKSVRAHLAEVPADAALILSRPRIRWLSGFSGSNGFALIAPDVAAMFTDSRYTEQCAEQCVDFDCHTLSGPLFAGLANFEWSGKRLLFDPEVVSVRDKERVERHAPGVDMVAMAGWMNPIVAQKQQDEVALIEASQRLNEVVFERVVSGIQPGVTEREIAAEIVYQSLLGGADSMAFDPIVASGPNGALPHARPTDRRLERGDTVVIDMGCYQAGYASDMTRVLSLGPPSNEFRDAYEVVRRAKNEAIEHAKSGLPASVLDGFARRVIEAAGFGDNFVHSLGHGLGTDIHEWPRLASTSEDVLPDRSVVTIEPGIYVPGKWGIRVEDIVVLRPDGCDNLTRVPDDLRELTV